MSTGYLVTWVYRMTSPASRLEDTDLVDLYLRRLSQRAKWSFSVGAREIPFRDSVSIINKKEDLSCSSILFLANLIYLPAWKISSGEHPDVIKQWRILQMRESLTQKEKKSTLDALIPSLPFTHVLDIKRTRSSRVDITPSTLSWSSEAFPPVSKPWTNNRLCPVISFDKSIFSSPTLMKDRMPRASTFCCTLDIIAFIDQDSCAFPINLICVDGHSDTMFSLVIICCLRCKLGESDNAYWNACHVRSASHTSVFFMYHYHFPRTSEGESERKNNAGYLSVFLYTAEW